VNDHRDLIEVAELNSRLSPIAMRTCQRMVRAIHCNVAAAGVGAHDDECQDASLSTSGQDCSGGDAWGAWSHRITLEQRIVHFEAAVVSNEAQPTQLMHRSLTWSCRSRWSRKPGAAR